MTSSARGRDCATSFAQPSTESALARFIGKSATARCSPASASPSGPQCRGSTRRGDMPLRKETITAGRPARLRMTSPSRPWFRLEAADAEAMNRVIAIVRRQWAENPNDPPPVVVVSAMSKVTDRLVETGRAGIHHLMMELYMLDDVGQAYDLAQSRKVPLPVVALTLFTPGMLAAGIGQAFGLHQRLRQRFDLEPHIDELPRPQLKPRVGEFRLQLHRAGVLIDLIVDAT